VSARTNWSVLARRKWRFVMISSQCSGSLDSGIFSRSLCKQCTYDNRKRKKKMTEYQLKITYGDL
jgi:hypothetical protein